MHLNPQIRLILYMFLKGNIHTNRTLKNAKNENIILEVDFHSALISVFQRSEGIFWDEVGLRGELWDGSRISLFPGQTHESTCTCYLRKFTWLLIRGM